MDGAGLAMWRSASQSVKEDGQVIYVNRMMAVSHRHYVTNSNNMMKAMEKLASGLRINRAADDPAGLAISERMRAQIRGLRQAQRNALDGISLLQVAEGALNESHAILQRMRELAVQAATDTNSDAERRHIQAEIDQLIAELTRIGDTTEFNTMSLLDGSFTGKKLHVGANSGQYIELSIGDMRAGALGVGPGLSVLTQGDADEAIGTIDDAIRAVSSQRSTLGALQNRLEHTVNNLGTTAENLQAAESRIRDVDMAEAVMQFVRQQILMQVSIAVMAQANASAQMVLRLLP